MRMRCNRPPTTGNGAESLWSAGRGRGKIGHCVCPRLTQESQVTRFSELTDYVAIPAVTSLRLSPDGGWLAAAVQSLGPEPGKFGTSIWRIDTGAAPPSRLTRSAEGESAPEFLADGSLLFVSKRPEPGPKPEGTAEPAKGALWLLPPVRPAPPRLAPPPRAL